MANNPSFASVPRLQVVSVSTGNTNKNGTGTITQLFVAGSNGSRVDKIYIKATQTVTQGAIRFFVHNGIDGYRMIFEQVVPPTTSSGTDNSYYKQLDNSNSFLPIVLPYGHYLGVSTNNSETFNIIALGGDF